MKFEVGFGDDGLLPEGIHEITWEELNRHFAFSPRRKELLEGLGKVINVLKNCGMTAIYVDGSFVTDKLEPGDWDACFDCSSDMSLRLFLSRYPLRDRELQKSLYKGELFPSWVFADNKGTKYIDFFQKLKITDVKKGILKMKLQDHDTE